MGNVCSGGILVYKYVNEKLNVLLAHPGGPYWESKENQCWSIPKGLQEDGEDILITARREFKEETGYEVSGELISLGTIKQPSGKLVTIFAKEMDIDVSKAKSNLFEMEWPPKSGKMEMFPENDRVEWFDIETANQKILKGQRGFLTRLLEELQK